MHKKHLLSLVMLLFFLVSFGQEGIRISGKIVDQETKEPLAFSHVGIFNTSYGTVSNIDGEFSLIIPNDFLDESISASYLGYGLRTIPISQISEKELVIELKSTVTVLPELIIQTKQKSIIEEAIAAIPQNHDQGQMLLRAFWRASIQDDAQEYVQMTEYAFDMYRHGENGEEENAMKILRGRVARDTSFFEAIAGMQIGITPPSLFVSSLLIEHPILEKAILKRHSYKITDVTSYNDRAVYVVSFEPKKKQTGKGYRGKILLDTETLAFVKLSFTKLISEENPEKVFNSLSLAAMVVGLGKSTVDSYENELNYQLVNGKWYLSHAKYDIKWTMRRNQEDIVRPVNLKADYVVTAVEKNDIVLPPAEELASKEILERQLSTNSDDFWKGYNYLKADNNFEELFQEILNR